MIYREPGAAPSGRIDLPSVLRDLAGLAGAGAVAYGAWCIYAPAGFITGGLLVLTGVFFAARADR